VTYLTFLIPNVLYRRAGADDIPIDINSDLYRNLVQALMRAAAKAVGRP
jgi:hypothetical protein